MDKMRNARKTGEQKGGNHKESPGKEVEVVWACDEKRGALHRKEGDGNVRPSYMETYIVKHRPHI